MLSFIKSRSARLLSFHDAQAETLRQAFPRRFDIRVIQDLVQSLHDGIGVDRRPIAMVRKYGPRVEKGFG
jgi:hypothetical protein